jgi:Zn-dependent protease with chaperone function
MGVGRMATKWTNEAFEAYVRRLEPEAQANPAAYRQKIIGWIALGYGFIALLLIGTLALLGLVIGVMVAGRFSGALIKVAIILLAFAFTLLRSLWIKVTEPEGVPLTRDDAPPLFEMVERLRQKTDAPKFSKLLLTTEFNAAAAQLPRLGIFGWPKNYLIVGLPLMQALSPQEFESVIAHELGHLRSGHANFGSKVYRVFETWERLSESGTGLLASFANWYFPRLSAYTFPLRRQDEYEADKIAAEAVGARVAADALCGIHVRSEVLKKKLWEPLQKRLAVETEAPRHIFQEQGRILRQERTEPEADQRTLRHALLEDTTFADSHPALKDRLAALGVEPRIPEKPTHSAAEAFFGSNLSRLTELLDGIWYREAAQSWRTGHAQAKVARNKFELLATKRNNDESLTDEEAYEYASGIEEYEGEDAALPLYRALFDSEKGNPARFDVGRILIARDEPEGAVLLEELSQRWPLATGAAMSLLRDYHKRVGDEDAARQAYTRALRHADQVNEWREERTQLTQKDTLIAHGQSDEKVTELRETLAKFDELGKAYLVQKKVANFAQDTEFLILVIQLKKKTVRMNEEADFKKLYEAVNEAVPMPVVPAYGTFAWIRKPVEAIPDSLIYAA